MVDSTSIALAALFSVAGFCGSLAVRYLPINSDGQVWLGVLGYTVFFLIIIGVIYAIFLCNIIEKAKQTGYEKSVYFFIVIGIIFVLAIILFVVGTSS